MRRGARSGFVRRCSPSQAGSSRVRRRFARAEPRARASSRASCAIRRAMQHAGSPRDREAN
eukprot:2575824-Pleurochrysis_carterae.AAC.2